MTNLTFEEALARLENIIESLEDGEMTLDDSLKLFEEGVGLYRICNQQLQSAEKKIAMIVEENNELKEIPFKYGEE